MLICVWGYRRCRGVGLLLGAASSEQGVICSESRVQSYLSIIIICYLFIVNGHGAAMVMICFVDGHGIVMLVIVMLILVIVQ